MCTHTAKKCSLGIPCHHARHDFVPRVALVAPKVAVVDELGAVLTKSVVTVYIHPARVSAIVHLAASWPYVDLLAFLASNCGDVNHCCQLGRFGTSTIT